jgi:hypothetical protein
VQTYILKFFIFSSVSLTALVKVGSTGIIRRIHSWSLYQSGQPMSMTILGLGISSMRKRSATETIRQGAVRSKIDFKCLRTIRGNNNDMLLVHIWSRVVLSLVNLCRSD